jgi:hypothetical protein
VEEESGGGAPTTANNGRENPARTGENTDFLVDSKSRTPKAEDSPAQWSIKKREVWARSTEDFGRSEDQHEELVDTQWEGFGRAFPSSAF